MAGPIRLRDVRQAHNRLSRMHRAAVDQAVDSAGRHAKHHVKTASKFRRRSPPNKSAKDKTEWKTVRTSRGRIVRVRNTARHARVLESGSRPHRITARRKKALRFEVGGQVVFRRSVMHPGTRPTRFLWRATRSAFRVAGKRLQSNMARVARRF